MIDIKTLRIGSTVLLKGERVEVEEIDNLRELVGFKGIYFKRDGERYNEWYRPQDLDPIPITEELLKELGFDEIKGDWIYGIATVFSKDFINDDGVLDFISLAQYEGGLYQLQVLGTTAFVRNLHEAEAFVYLTTKQELI